MQMYSHIYFVIFLQYIYYIIFSINPHCAFFKKNGKKLIAIRSILNKSIDFLSYCYFFFSNPQFFSSKFYYKKFNLMYNIHIHILIDKNFNNNTFLFFKVILNYFIHLKIDSEIKVVIYDICCVL